MYECKSSGSNPLLLRNYSFFSRIPLSWSMFENEILWGFEERICKELYITLNMMRSSSYAKFLFPSISNR